MFENIDAEAQFSYMHSDGTVISSKKASFKTEKSEEDVINYYAEVKNKKATLYTTYASLKSPQKVYQVYIDAIPVSDLDFEEKVIVLPDNGGASSPIQLMVVYTDSPQMQQGYFEENGVKSKMQPSESTNTSFFFPTHAPAKAFVEEMIASLPADKQEDARAKFKKHYEVMTGEMIRQDEVKVQKQEAVDSYKPIYFKKHGEIMFSIYYDKSTASSLNTKVYRGDKAKLLFTTYKDVYEGKLSKTAQFENCSYCSIHAIMDVGSNVITIKNKPNAIQYQIVYKNNYWYLIKGTGTNTEVDYNSNFDKIEIGYTSGDGDIYGKSAMSVESEVKLNAKTTLWVMAMLHMSGYIADDGTFGD